MKTPSRYFLAIVILLTTVSVATAANTDSLTIHNLGHASVMLEFGDKVIHIDPRASEANYAALPDADIICITHDHGDHYDLSAINLIKKAGTMMIWTQAVKNLNSYAGENHVMNNGDSLNIDGVAIKAVPAYNIVNLNGNGQPFHPKGNGNGYVFTFNDLRVYLAGDTENIPEMDGLNVDIAFIPMNLPYTMAPEMAADVAQKLNPEILYIYHYGNSNTNTLKTLLKDEKIEIRIGESSFVESTTDAGQTGLLPMDRMQKTRIYPNPTNGFITVEYENDKASLLVFDMSGKLQLRKFELDRGNNLVDLWSLPNGNYLLQIESESVASVWHPLTLLK